MTVFTWSSGNYPGIAPPAWNGQPLAVAPAQNYFTPSPQNNPTKIPAENWNYILSQIAANLGNLQPAAISIVTATSSLIVPANCRTILWDLCGQGGGGGGGCGGISAAANAAYPGGAGGAGARRIQGFGVVNPGDSLLCTVGSSGGTGGAQGAAGAFPTSGGPGLDGAASIIFNTTATRTLVTAPGGAGGGAGLNSFAAVPNSSNTWVPGGAGPQGSSRGAIPAFQITVANPFIQFRHGDGGAAIASANGTLTTFSFDGAPSEYWAGGAHGANGTVTGGFQWGGGGGGGGGGGFGPGGAGGVGGNGSGGVATAGNAATSLLANTGAGGGGGGAGGGGGTTGGQGGLGATGSSGLILVYFLPIGG